MQLGITIYVNIYQDPFDSSIHSISPYDTPDEAEQMAKKCVLIEYIEIAKPVTVFYDSENKAR